MIATSTQRLHGTIVKWFIDKQFGFIRPNDAAPGDRDQDIFCHGTQISGPVREGDAVSYCPRINSDGRCRAVDVQREG